MPCRILYVSEATTFGGAERYLGILWQGMDRRMFAPVLFCHPDSPPALVQIARRLSVPLKLVEPIEGKRHPAGILRGRRLFREAAPDIVHFNMINAYQGQYSVLAAHGSGIPRLVATYHLPPRSRTRSAAGRLLERVVAACLDRTIAVCTSGGELLVRYLRLPRERMTVVQNGIELERFTPGPGTAHEALRGRKVVIAVGRLTPQKGLSFLIEAAPEVIRAVPDAGFLIVGEGPLRPDLERAARASGLGDAVVFAGEREDVHDLIRGAQVLVLPSIYEGLPLVALEGMACGRPVVASDVDGIPEAVVHGETGVLLPSGQVEALADSLVTLLRNPRRCAKMGRLGRRRVEERFSAERMVRKTEEVYDLAGR